MKTSALKTSKFLTKDDAGEGILVTMRKLTEENVEMEGKPERMKWVLHFDGNYKPLVLNSTNIASIERIHGDETDEWMGKQIVLFNDENVSFGGEITGGVRVDINRTKRYLAKGKIPQNTPEPTTMPQKPAGSIHDMESDIPF